MNRDLFQECDTCRAKPGSPELCHGCYHNRSVIDKLNSMVSLKDKLKKNRELYGKGSGDGYWDSQVEVIKEHYKIK